MNKLLGIAFLILVWAGTAQALTATCRMFDGRVSITFEEKELALKRRQDNRIGNVRPYVNVPARVEWQLRGAPKKTRDAFVEVTGWYAYQSRLENNKVGYVIEQDTGFIQITAFWSRIPDKHGYNESAARILIGARDSYVSGSPFEKQKADCIIRQ